MKSWSPASVGLRTDGITTSTASPAPMSMGGEITIRLPSLLTVSAHIGADIEAFVAKSETVKREEQSGRVGKLPAGACMLIVPVPVARAPVADVVKPTV